MLKKNNVLQTKSTQAIPEAKRKQPGYFGSKRVILHKGWIHERAVDVYSQEVSQRHNIRKSKFILLEL